MVSPFVRYGGPTVLLAIHISLTWFNVVAAVGKGPYPLPDGWESDGKLLLTNENPSRRTDFCARQTEVTSGIRNIRDALDGMNISVMVNLMEWGEFNGTFGSCKDGVESAGCVFLGSIMDELSQRAGFSYKDSWSFGDSRNAKDYTSWMLWVAANYDVGIGIATETADRLAEGLVWNAHLTDNSFVLASRKVAEEMPVMNSLFQFLTPFSWEVWAMLILGGLLSSALYVATERHVNTIDLPEGPLLAQLGDAFMLACFQFTGAGGFAPMTAAGRGITFSWSFTVLLTVSAYTANLASFLISKKEALVPLVSIDEANHLRTPICHRRGWAIERFLEINYPGVRRVPTDSQAEVWAKLQAGECQAEALFLSEFRMEEVKNSYNPDCEMALTPALPFSKQGGGWYSQSDSGFLCTGLLKDVFRLHIAEMEADGTIADKFNALVAFGGEADPRPSGPCGADAGSDDADEETQQLHPANMGGIYITHAVLTLIAAFTILELCLYRRAHTHSGSSSPAEACGDLRLCVFPVASQPDPGTEAPASGASAVAFRRRGKRKVRVTVPGPAAAAPGGSELEGVRRESQQSESAQLCEGCERLREELRGAAEAQERGMAELRQMLAVQMQLLGALAHQHRLPSSAQAPLHTAPLSPRKPLPPLPAQRPAQAGRASLECLSAASFKSVLAGNDAAAEAEQAEQAEASLAVAQARGGDAREDGVPSVVAEWELVRAVQPEMRETQGPVLLERRVA